LSILERLIGVSVCPSPVGEGILFRRRDGPPFMTRIEGLMDELCLNLFWLQRLSSTWLVAKTTTCEDEDQECWHHNGYAHEQISSGHAWGSEERLYDTKGIDAGMQ